MASTSYDRRRQQTAYQRALLIRKLAAKGLTREQVVVASGIPRTTIGRIAWQYSIRFAREQHRVRKGPTEKTRPHDMPRYLDPPCSPPSPAMWALAEFDPIILRAAKARLRQSQGTT